MLIDLYILCIYVICVLIIRWYMTETDFLDDYDPTAFERPSVTVDLVLLGLRQGSPTALLVKRQQNPFAGQWALPGGFVRIDEAVDDAAKRILHDKAGIQSAHLEQLYTFGSVNQTGTFLGMRAALPVMAANGGGSIVNISSLLGLLGFPGMIAYSASKGAIRTMTKAVAMECVSNNIRVNTIVPGAMQTPIQANVTAEADARSEEHTSELQSLMRISYAVFCLKKKKKLNTTNITLPFTWTAQILI